MYKGHRIAMQWREQPLAPGQFAKRFVATFIIRIRGQAVRNSPTTEHVFDTALNAGNHAFDTAKQTIDAKLEAMRLALVPI